MNSTIIMFLIMSQSMAFYIKCTIMRNEKDLHSVALFTSPSTFVLSSIKIFKHATNFNCCAIISNCPADFAMSSETFLLIVKLCIKIS
ncbi:hypothetical protein PUN28_009101 [Cardiocondyla obscurior]|uniref:Secreted protein n=1 Tax=Cardiocondyla obscurior TaxID=286306 RepID=A0AAW2FQH5_9HYME